MPSTGVTSFTITGDALITASLRILGVVQDGEPAKQNMLNDARESLNLLLKNMQSKGLQLWTYDLIPIPCQVGKTEYTIGPVGADITHVRPLRLFDGAYIRYTPSYGLPVDTPLRVLSRLEYLQFSSKSSPGTTNSVYYHPGIDTPSGVTSPSTGYGTLKVYVTPVDNTRTIWGNFQRPIYDVNNTDDEFDLPHEWLLPLKWLLAADLMSDYRVALEERMYIDKKALYYQGEIQNWSVELAPVVFQPDMMMYR